MKKLTAILYVASTLMVLTSCGSGVKDRPISSSTNQSTGNSGLTLTSAEITALAESRIAKELDELGIDEYYTQAKAIQTNHNFSSLKNFLEVSCVNNASLQAVNKFKSYGKLLHDVSTQEHVVALIDDILLILSSEEQTSLSANQLAVLYKALEKANKYRTDIAAKAVQCKSVIYTGPAEEEGEQAPNPNPPADS